jgi:hypothetical protein
MSSVHSEIFKRFERPIGSPPRATRDEAYRRLLRSFLTSQVGFERAQSLRQTLLFALTAMSLALWLVAALPELLPVEDVIRIRTGQHGAAAV